MLITNEKMKIKKIPFVIFYVHMDLILVLEWEHKSVLVLKCTKETFFSSSESYIMIHTV